jgi:acyl-CoA dehydrogenase
MTDEVELLRQQARRFALTAIVPQLERWRQQGYADREFWPKVADAGLLLPELPEKYDGGGGSNKHAMVILDEFARHEGPVANYLVNSIVAHYILDYGTVEQKQRWLPRLACGEWIGGIAMTEPGCGSDLKQVRTRAVRDGEHYLINGTKTFITSGYAAGLMVIATRTDPVAGAKGISLFVVETGSQPGFKVGRILEKIGMKTSDTCELAFEDMRVLADNLLGGVEGEGFTQLMSQLPYERLLIAVSACAVIDRALDLTVEYTKSRKAFGRAIFDFQTTRHKLAEVATVAHVVRTFANDCIQQLEDGVLDAETAYMAKWWCTEQQCRVVDECVQLFGGYGYMFEYPIARLYADSRAQKIYGGTNEIMKDLIARKL